MSNSDHRPVALVSGGSRGIGRAVVRRLAADGYDVAFCYQSRADAAAVVVEEIKQSGARATASQVDVADAAAVNAWIAATESEFGPVAAVVTSAGVVRDKPIVTMSDSDWHAVVDTNLGGVFNVCKAMVFPMMKRRAGTIINISSVSGIYGNPGQTNYSAAKAGIIGLTKALAKETGRFGIRANVVAPGFIDTEMTADLSETTRTEMIGRIPLGRWGTADEVADVVAFLASPQSAYLTAGIFQIDGGMSL